MKIPQGLSYTEADYRRAEHFGDQEALNAMAAEWNALEADPVQDGELTEEQYEKSFGMPTDEGGSR